MSNYLEELLGPSIIELSSAQRLRVFEAAMPLAAARKDKELKDHLAGAVAHEIEVRKLEVQWNAGTSHRAAYVPEMGPLDDRSDKHITSIRDLVLAQIRGEGVSEEAKQKAAELLAALFPGGDVSKVTGQSYVDQGKAMEDMLKTLRGSHKDHATYFGLGQKVATLAELTAEYQATLARSPAALQASQVQAAQDRAYRYLCEVVSRVMGLCFNSDNPQHVADLGSVMAVLFEEMEQTRSRTKARRSARKRRKRGDDSGDHGSNGGTAGGNGGALGAASTAGS